MSNRPDLLNAPPELRAELAKPRRRESDAYVQAVFNLSIADDESPGHKKGTSGVIPLGPLFPPASGQQ